MDDSVPPPSTSPPHPPPAESPYPSHSLLLLSVDPHSTFAQLKAELQRLPTCSPTALLSAFYQGALVANTDVVADRIAFPASLSPAPFLTVIAVEPPPDTAPSPSLSSNPFASPSASSPSSSSASASSPSSRRPPPEQLLADLNRLITPELLSPLLDMGFSESRSIKALVRSMLNPELAISWLLEHADDADIDDPLTPHQLYQIAFAFHLIPSPAIEMCIAAGVCTFSLTARQYAPQQYFLCHTCGLTGGRGCCVSCARVCHAGHEVEGPVHSESFFCDCGAGDGGIVCQAVRPAGWSEAKAAEDALKEKAKAADERAALQAEQSRAREANTPARFLRRLNERIAINELDPCDYVAFLTAFVHHNPAVAHSHSRHADPTVAQLQTALIDPDERAVLTWCAQHARDVLEALYSQHTPLTLDERVELLAEALPFLPVHQAAHHQPLLALVQRLMTECQRARERGAQSDVRPLLSLLINLFAAPTAIVFVPPLYALVLATCRAVPPSAQPATRLLVAEALFNVCLLLRHTGEAHPELLSLTIGRIASESQEHNARVLIQGLTAFLLLQRREVKLLAVKLGLASALEPIIARKTERASAFAQLLIRLVRAG